MYTHDDKFTGCNHIIHCEFIGYNIVNPIQILYTSQGEKLLAKDVYCIIKSKSHSQ